VRKRLIPSHITLRHNLNAFEQPNILKARTWALSRRDDSIAKPFGRRLHKRMFANAWNWAGEYRRSDKNIGVEWTQIPACVAVAGLRHHGRARR
jgi:fido (protein-threonine AMPylation protein)